MLDEFLKVAYTTDRSNEQSTKLSSVMARTLPKETLMKIASGELKFSHMMGCGSNSDAEWLDRFKGTELFEQAMSLEQAELDLESQRLQQQVVRRTEDTIYDQEQDIRLKKRMLDLELARHESVAGGAAPEAPTAAPPPAAEPPPDMAAGPKTASDNSPISYGDKAWGTDRELAGQGLGAGAGALIGGLSGMGHPQTAASRAMLGGALGLLGGGAVGHYTQPAELRTKIREARIQAQGAGMGLVDAKAEMARRVKGRESGVTPDEAARSYGDDVAMNRAIVGMGGGSGLGLLAGAGLGAAAGHGGTGALLGGLAGGALGYHAGKSSGHGRGHELMDELRSEGKLAFVQKLASEMATADVLRARFQKTAAFGSVGIVDKLRKAVPGNMGHTLSTEAGAAKPALNRAATFRPGSSDVEHFSRGFDTKKTEKVFGHHDKGFGFGQRPMASTAHSPSFSSADIETAKKAMAKTAAGLAGLGQAALGIAKANPSAVAGAALGAGAGAIKGMSDPNRSAGSVAANMLGGGALGTAGGLAAGTGIDVAKRMSGKNPQALGSALQGSVNNRIMHTGLAAGADKKTLAGYMVGARPSAAAGKVRAAEATRTSTMNPGFGDASAGVAGAKPPVVPTGTVAAPAAAGVVTPAPVAPPTKPILALPAGPQQAPAGYGS